MLRYSKERLVEEKSITDIYFKAQLELDVRKELYENFRRKLTDEELASLDDEDIKVPLERYISVMSAGYFGGKAPTYKVKAFNKDKDKIIKELFNHETNDEKEIIEIKELIKHINDYNNDASHFLHMVLDYLIKRACYEIYYKDEKTGEITIARSDALETIAIWDYSAKKNLIGIYRIIRTYMANGEYQQMIELTTADGKRYYYDTPEKRKIFGTPAYEQKFKDEPLFKENIKEQQPKKWDDDIPATAIENCDGIAIFEPVISLIRAYERCIQNSRNVFKYNDEAIFYDEQPVSLKVALRQRLRWSKGHLQAFAESGWGLFKNIFIDPHTQRYEDDKWYNYTWRTIRHRFMSFDTFAQLLPKNIINIFRWIIVYLILYPFFCSQFGLDNIRILYNSTWLAHVITHIFGDITVSLPAGAETYVLTILIEIWVRIYYRIGLYFFKTLEAVYLFIIENKRMPKISIWKKILYCFTWPTFDIIGRYTQYVALFKKVEWKPIPHKSEITIDDISQD